MRINYIGSQNIRFVVALWMLLCWVFGASAAEKWDAKTTARVNLRRNPSSNGVILSIIPKGYRVRIMEKQGLWSKIDVEGDIHGKGWVYAEYLEEILSKVNDVSTQPSMIEEIPPGGDRSEDQSRLKIPTVGKPPQTAPVQASPEIRTEDEKEKPIDPQQVAALLEREHAWISRMSGSASGFRLDLPDHLTGVGVVAAVALRERVAGDRCAVDQQRRIGMGLPGPINADVRDIVLPPSEDTYTRMESLISHFNIIYK